MPARPVFTIARYVALEALRTRLPWLTLGMLAVIAAASHFVQSLAITESARVEIAFFAATVRLAAVFLVSLHVLGSMTREFDDKGLELLLSFDLPRANYVLGKLAGFVFVAWLLVVPVAAVVFILAPAVAALQWSCALALELTLIVALSLFAIVTFSQLLPAASFVFAFYLLARALTAIQLIGQSPLAGGAAQRVMGWAVDGLALVLPALDRFTQTTWLVDGAGTWLSLIALAGQTALYTALLAAAAMFDFYRRNL